MTAASLCTLGLGSFTSPSSLLSLGLLGTQATQYPTPSWRIYTARTAQPGEIPPFNIFQSPTELLDYQINWPTTVLGTDTITNSTWAFTGNDTALTLSVSLIGSPATNTTIWLSGGTLDTCYTVTNTITTQGGRTLTESFIVTIIPQRFVC